MPTRLPFGARFDDAAGSIVGNPHRRPGPIAGQTGVRFRYPPLEALAEAEPPELAADAPEPAPPPPPSFSAEELAGAVQAARQEASAEAEARVRTEIIASLEQQQTEALAAIAARLAAGQDVLDRLLAARAGASRDLALAVARALVAKALARQPLADIEAMFREVVVRLEGLPSLELRLPPSLVPAGQESLARAAAEADYRGEIRVIADARLGAGDARLIWQDGAAERDLARLEAEVTLLVETWLPGPRAEAQPPSADADDARMDGFQ